MGHEEVIAYGVNKQDAQRLLEGRHASPHAILGCHPHAQDGRVGIVVRALHPDARAVSVAVQGIEVSLDAQGGGLFASFIEGVSAPQRVTLTYHFDDGQIWRLGDPYSHWPTLGDQDLHLFNEGNHFRVWEVLGASSRQHEGVWGTAFAVWAPNALSVSVVGDFNNWDRRLQPMRAMGSSGIFELFVPGVSPGARYQFDIRLDHGEVLRKSDPFAKAADHPPQRASVVTGESPYAWGDAEYLAARTQRDPLRAAMSVYEVHLGSFRRGHDGRALNYRQLADAIIPHMRHFGFTHLELLPVAEHPFDGSWGYQVTGFYAPTSRYGSPDDFRYLVDQCHRQGIGVIIDWVPAHFPKDDFALARFDGTPLFEHADPRQGEHPDWGTLIFNYGRKEVANFLLGSALYFLEEFHVDGLRVDAVASMLYLDYSREAGQWVPNAYGGRENLEAINFIRHLNGVIADRYPGCYTIAEESTSWPLVTTPATQGGLGFSLKWNMGWMHDTLVYFAHDPIHRRFHHDELTFASVYEHSEKFLMPLSHDEVVHGKRSLLAKMPGDRWRKFANLRCLFAYQYTRPGKKLVFMGSEFAPEHEWNHAAQLPWPDAHDGERQAFMRFFASLGQLYLSLGALHGSDLEDGGFRWIDTSDHEQSVFVYQRCLGEQRVLLVMNLTPVPRPAYRVGSPCAGRYLLRLNSDSGDFGGSDCLKDSQFSTQAVPFHACEHSLVLDLPPLAVLILLHEETDAQRQARQLGIAESFYTIDGARHLTTEVTRAALIEALQGRGALLTGDAADSGAVPAEPLQVFQPVDAFGSARVNGIWTQLYTVHSERSWGIGDFADLKQLLHFCADSGLDFIGLNPLHATHLHAQPAIPYHPTSRLFDSPLYIAVPEVPEFVAYQQAHGMPAELSAQIERLMGGHEVDYPAVWQLKQAALRRAFDQLLLLEERHPRRQAFAEFVTRGGLTLRRFATYCAIEESLWAAGQQAYGFAAFPAEYQSPNNPQVERFAQEHAYDVSFFAYLQFLCDEQLGQCKALSKSLGLRVGLYLDLAVGAAHGGFDDWNFRHVYVDGASLGAPPDELAPQGQDWGIVPLHPHALLADSLSHVREIFAHSMRHAGAVRIDHAMWMARQFWIPRAVRSTGTYVRFPLTPILDVLCDESRKAECIVIGEDLGTVPEGFREELKARGVLRYEVVHFNREGDGSFPPTDRYAPDALLCLSTHDLPTFGEHLAGHDLLLRRELGVLSPEAMLAQVDRRVRDRAHLLRWLDDNALPVPEDAGALDVLTLVHRLLAAAPSVLLALSLDDLCDEPHSVNVPGTSADDGFVSFARRMARSLTDIAADQALRDQLLTLARLRSQKGTS